MIRCQRENWFVQSVAKQRDLAIVGGLLGLSMLQGACHAKSDALDRGAAPAESVTSTLDRFRADVAAASTISKTEVIWLSHVLVRHSTSSSAAPFGPSEWKFHSPAPRRAASEARQLARDLREVLADRPARFAEVAKESSEDDFTRDVGGSLGGIAYAQLQPSPNVLAAVHRLRVGDISEVIETAAGFHVFQRQSEPPPTTVSGLRIVIGHDNSEWLWKHLARPGSPRSPRSHEEARQLAESLYTRALREPEDFAAFVAQYSNHRDALRGGDFGEWRTDEVTPFPREIEVLTRLRVGDVHAPIDTPIGFQIIQRTPERSRKQYSAAVVRLRYSAERGGFGDRALVEQQADKLADGIRARPTLFDDVRSELCCADPISWIEGRRSPMLELALDVLASGQISSAPVETDGAFFIIKRL